MTVGLSSLPTRVSDPRWPTIKIFFTVRKFQKLDIGCPGIIVRAGDLRPSTKAPSDWHGQISIGMKILKLRSMPKLLVGCFQSMHHD